MTYGTIDNDRGPYHKISRVIDEKNERNIM